MAVPKIRLFVEHPLGQGQSVPLTRDQAHYLLNVMRRTAGESVLVFNGKDGEWQARLASLDRRGAQAECLEQTGPQRGPPDLWLLFAPIKKARTDFIVEKAAELGVARIMPVQTQHTNSERVRRDRLRAHAVEAAEQCGGTFVPVVDDLVRLVDVLDKWPEERRLMFCDESRAGERLSLDDKPGPWAILIGPEGGFSDAERKRLLDLPQSTPVSLGPRILRADTAVVAAITLWQHVLGDWRHPKPVLDNEV